MDRLHNNNLESSMLKSLFVSFAATMLMVLAGTAVAADKAPIRIALIDPLSGPMAAVGQPALAQLQFDAARLNKEGGINGHKIEVVGLDNKINPQESLVQLQKAIDDGIHYITQGNGSSVGSALLAAVNKHNQRNPNDRVLYFNYAAVDPAFTNERCSFWHFRFDANSDMKMNAMTDWIAKNKNIHKIFLIDQDYSFGHAVSEAAQKMLKQKRPDIEIVGNVFHPLAKVKDFTPYITKIKASGADAVITGNWGQDITLLVKAAADYGLDIPILSYYGNSPGTVTQLGEKGVDRLYLVAELSGDYSTPELGQRETDMYKEKGWDFGYLRITDMMEMWKQAAEKANSIDPTKVAFALEGLKYDSLTGPVEMRAQDHQILLPYYISVLKNNVKYGLEGTTFGFHGLHKLSAEQMAMPSTCKMQRPKQ